MTFSPLTRTGVIAAIVIGAAATLPAWAQYRDQYKPTPLEIARLPKYCQGQFKRELAKLPGYSITPGCGWTNHLCPGLVLLNRAADVSMARPARQYALSQVDGELAYTRQHMTRACPMGQVLAQELASAEFRMKILQMSLK